jgi:indole-3-glycerol phosphate synthase
MGADSYLREIADCVSLPLLRKDFTVDEYMIYEAKILGADAVLLICTILDNKQLCEYIKIADSLGLSALVETHDEREIEAAMAAGARLIGVNNRNLATFEVDITLSERLRRLVPKEIVFVAESGIKTPQDIENLRKAGVDSVLIGETLMRGANLQWLKSKQV